MRICILICIFAHLIEGWVRHANARWDRKNIDVLREVQCLRSRAVDRVYTYTFIRGVYVYADSTRILWRVCRGDSIRKAVRSGVWLLHRGSTIQRGENWGCVGVKVDSCWYSPLCACTLIKAMVAPVQFICEFSSKLVVATKTAIFTESQGEYKMKSWAKYYVDLMFCPQPYFSHKFSVTFF